VAHRWGYAVSDAELTETIDGLGRLLITCCVGTLRCVEGTRWTAYRLMAQAGCPHVPAEVRAEVMYEAIVQERVAAMTNEERAAWTEMLLDDVRRSMRTK